MRPLTFRPQPAAKAIVKRLPRKEKLEPSGLSQLDHIQATRASTKSVTLPKFKFLEGKNAT